MRPLFTLTKRLSVIAELVEKNSVVCDIGTDHALLPIWLVKKGITDKVIASDIIDGPLLNAEKNIKAYCCEDKITVVKSDGLKNVLKYEPTNIIIAGMGAETICEILSFSDYAKEKSPLLILQPMTRCEVLRKYLMQNGFSILSEQVLFEQGHHYVVLTARYLQEQRHYFDTANTKSEVLYELGGITNTYSDFLNYKKEKYLYSYNQIKENSMDFDGKEGKLNSLLDFINEIDKRLLEDKNG